jgi:hypothetical protein
VILIPTVTGSITESLDHPGRVRRHGQSRALWSDVGGAGEVEVSE